MMEEDGAVSCTADNLARDDLATAASGCNLHGEESALISFSPDCYLRGTRILTPTGEVAVESLQTGDRVVTRFHGIQIVRWVGRQSFTGPFAGADRDKLPVCIHAGALGDRLPARDLFVSEGLSMLIEGMLVPAAALVNGMTVTRGEAPGALEYYQLDLGAHDCVIAEGTWAESYADAEGRRARFHNAAEFAALYPGSPVPAAPELCAPRPDRGAMLDAVLRPVVEHALAGHPLGPVRGSIDYVAGGWTVEGWAQDVEHPELPVLLDVLQGDTVLGTVLACHHRPDLQEVGIGQGRAAFIFDTPMEIPRAAMASLRVRRTADGAELHMSDACRETVLSMLPDMTDLPQLQELPWPA